ncbi:type IV pilus assembly protein FimV [Vreelandella sp. TE19]
MNKTLATSVWLVLATLSPAALALGLGHATTLSPLQAPLDATVDLLESDGYRVEDIRASVAEPSAFSALGLEWSPLLSSLQVTPARQNGRTFLRLSSAQAVSAPWLDVLITLDTPFGRQTQAVTLLFDPVDYLPGQPSAGVAGVGQTAAPPPAPTPSRPAPTASAQPDATHTTVQPGDTLWDIALRTRAPGVDVQQMIAALAEANPAAFAGESIDSLRVGQRLRLPSREEALGRSPQQAARAVSARSGESPARGAASPEPQNPAVAQAPAAPRAAEPSGGESNEQGSVREPASLPPAGEETDVEAAVLDALMASLSLESALAAGAGEADTPAAPLLADSGAAPTAVVSQALAPFSPLPAAKAAPNNGEYQALLDEQTRQAAEIDTLREEVAALRQTLGDVRTLALAQTGTVSASAPPSAPAPGVWASLRERWVWLAGLGLLLLLAAMVISRKRRERQWEAAPLPVTPVAPPASAAPPSHTVPAASSRVATPPDDETPEPPTPEGPGPQTLAVERRGLAEQDLMEPTPAPWAPNDAPDEPESAGAFSEALEPSEQDEPALAPKAPDSSSNHLIDYPPARATAPEDSGAKPLSQDVGATEPPSSTEPQWEIEEVAFKPRRRDNS